MTSALLDTNVILRFVLRDPKEHARRARALMLDLRRGDQTAYLPDTVVFECVFTLFKSYHVPRPEIRAAILGIVAFPGVSSPNPPVLRDAFDRWVAEPSLSFADSYHLSLAKSIGLTEIISFDRKIAKDPAVTRVEPALDGTLTPG